MRALIVCSVVCASCALLLTDCSSTEASPSPDVDAAPVPAADGAMSDVEAPAPCSPDLESDPKNCGRCGHDCLGGACAAGACQPVVLAYDQAGPRRIVLSDGYIYWYSASAGTISRVALAGGPPTVLLRGLHTTSTNQTDFTLDATKLYVRDLSRVMTLPREGLADGAAPVIRDDGPNASALPAIAVDASHVYIGSGGGGLYATTKDLAQPFTKIAQTPIFFYTREESTWGAQLVADSAGILSVNPVLGTIYLASKPADAGADAGDAGAAPGFTALVTQQALPSGLALDQGRMFWANFGSGSVRSAAISGAEAGAPTQVASGLGGPRAVAVDQGFVYFTTAKTGTVASCPISGCVGSPRVLVRGLAGPWGIATDDASVYFSDEVGGIIARVAK